MVTPLLSSKEDEKKTNKTKKRKNKIEKRTRVFCSQKKLKSKIPKEKITDINTTRLIVLLGNLLSYENGLTFDSMMSLIPIFCRSFLQSCDTVNYFFLLPFFFFFFLSISSVPSLLSNSNNQTQHR